MKNIYYISLGLALFSLGIGFLGWPNQFLVIGLVYFIVTYLLKTTSTKQSLILLLPFTLFYSGLCIAAENLAIVPIALICPIAVFLAQYVYRNKGYWVAGTYVCTLFLTSMWAYHVWISYLSDIKYRPLFSKIKTLDPTIKFYKESDNQLFDLNQYRDKTVVLDFWSVNCGSCIREMPEIEGFCKKNPDVVFFTVNGTTNDAELQEGKMLTQKYKIPKLYIKDPNLWSKLGFNVIPTVMILKNGNQVKFLGGGGYTPFQYGYINRLIKQ